MSIDTKPTESDTLKDVILDKDKQLDKEVPGSAFSLVTLSYLIALFLVLATIGTYYWLAV